ncbi:MAG: sigma-54-dependent Fis family transcriptional regulator [Candidatus Hydrogenedentes bacterium]|nr:sigma-54-dependent Fis family transcriptional regulator [Candidatus Hydrogenedentota bacterium]
MSRYRILVVDDDALMREYVEEAMVRAGHAADAVANGPDALARMEATIYDVAITDLKMAPMDGLELLRRARAVSPDTPVIVMTAYGTIESAVAALKEGAADYLLKPFTPDAIEVAVERCLERARIARENRYLRDEIDARYDFGAMIGDSPAMRVVYEQIRKVADSRATVFIRGETGTGKELAARAIHFAGSRRDRPFIKVNCAALSAGILESELFGHEKGAFTGAHDRKIGRFELADTGTLMLDEISEIPVDLQPKLLRALQEREFERVGGNIPIQVDTRIVATSNRDLEQAVRLGKLREDLFYRLNVVSIYLPPLRERKEDLPALMDHFLERFCRENGRRVRGFAPATRKRLLEYDWPGNVRELQNAVESAVVLAADDAPLPPEQVRLSGVQAAANGNDASGVTPGTTVAGIEKQLILVTLEHCAGNRTRAAEMLGISVRTLRNKLKEYRLAQDAEETE